jgi:hypothetical protein
MGAAMTGGDRDVVRDELSALGDLLDEILRLAKTAPILTAAGGAAGETVAGQSAATLADYVYARDLVRSLAAGIDELPPDEFDRLDLNADLRQLAFHLAEELASFDLPIATIEWELFEKHRFTYLRLVGQVLARARLDPAAGFVATWTTVEDLVEFGVAFDETEGLIDVIRQTAEATISCVIREAPGEGNRVSLRSTSSTDVGELARRFGGGGHSFMAGFVTFDPVPQLLDQIEAAVRRLEAP